jgi:hypothetical protein
MRAVPIDACRAKIPVDKFDKNGEPDIFPHSSCCPQLLVWCCAVAIEFRLRIKVRLSEVAGNSIKLSAFKVWRVPFASETSYGNLNPFWNAESSGVGCGLLAAHF